MEGILRLAGSPNGFGGDLRFGKSDGLAGADEICRQLGITTSNCHVLLHRARLKLRGCMENGWGRPGDAAC